MCNILMEHWRVECTHCHQHFEINAKDYDFQLESMESRNMGEEKCYSSEIENFKCPKCDTPIKKISLWEYPEASKNYAEGE